MTQKRKVKRPAYVPLDITFKKNWTQSGLMDSLLYPMYVPKSLRDKPKSPAAWEFTLRINAVDILLNTVDVDNLLKQLKDVLPASQVLA